MVHSKLASWILLSEQQVKLFVITAAGVSVVESSTGEKGLKCSLMLNPTKTSTMISNLSQTASRWKHTQLFFKNQQEMMRTLSAARHHLIDTEHYRVATCEMSLSRLCTAIDENGVWANKWSRTFTSTGHMPVSWISAC